MQEECKFINCPMIRIFILLLLLAEFSVDCFAHNPAFHHYSVDDGMPAMEVYNIVQDKKGLIWIATSKGVSRFDGSKFENFTVENGLPDNEVLKMYEDAKGRIWFLSLTGKISFYDEKIHNRGNTFFLAHAELQKPIMAFTPLITGEILFCPQDNPTFILKDTTVRLFAHSSNYSIFEKKDYSVLMVDNSNDYIVEWINGKLIRRGKAQYNSEYDICEYNKYLNIFLIAKKDGLYYFENDRQRFY